MQVYFKKQWQAFCEQGAHEAPAESRGEHVLVAGLPPILESPSGISVASGSRVHRAVCGANVNNCRLLSLRTCSEEEVLVSSTGDSRVKTPVST